MTPSKTEHELEELLLAVEEVGNAWYWSDDGEVVWREELWDRLVTLRRAYGAIEDGEVNALPALLAERKRLRTGLKRLADANDAHAVSSVMAATWPEVRAATEYARSLLAEQEATE